VKAEGGRAERGELASSDAAKRLKKRRI